MTYAVALNLARSDTFNREDEAFDTPDQMMAKLWNKRLGHPGLSQFQSAASYTSCMRANSHKFNPIHSRKV